MKNEPFLSKKVFEREEFLEFVRDELGLVEGIASFGRGMEYSQGILTVHETSLMRIRDFLSSDKYAEKSWAELTLISYMQAILLCFRFQLEKHSSEIVSCTSVEKMRPVQKATERWHEAPKESPFYITAAAVMAELIHCLPATKYKDLLARN